MILGDLEPVDLSLLVDLLGRIDRSAQPPPDRSTDDAFVTVAEGLAQQLERENEVRRALCWLLNQDDLVLDDLLARASEALARLDVGGQRGFLESLWDRLFADWLVEGFTMTDYDVSGLSG